MGSILSLLVSAEGAHLTEGSQALLGVLSEIGFWVHSGLVLIFLNLLPYGKHFHNPREWSSLDSLRRRTQAIALYLLRHA